MIFSYDERKAGSYFGADLYEKCIAVDKTAEGYDVIVNIPDAKTMVDALFFTKVMKSLRPLRLQANRISPAKVS